MTIGCRKPDGINNMSDADHQDTEEKIQMRACLL
jgi:hypothetical protein